MKFIRSVSVIVVLLLAVSPASALAGGSLASTAPLSQSPPAQLTTAAASTTPAPRHTPALHPAAAPAQSGELPHTGLNLLPETLLGIALLAAGIALRARRA